MKKNYLILIFTLLYNILIAQEVFNVIQVHLFRKGTQVNAELIVEDQLGRKTGYDPLLNLHYNEIPNSGYGNDSDTNNNPNEPITITNIFNIDPAFNGNYIIKVIGSASDSFNISIYTARGNGHGTDFQFKGVTSSGQINQYKLYYPTDTTKAITVEEIISNLRVKLVNSQNQLLLGGSLQYYDTGWKNADDHGDGTFSVNSELPSVKLRMTYEHGIQEMSNVATKGNTVVFKTVHANVELKDSQSRLIDTGTVQYYAGAWYDLGVTSGGVAYKELLPYNYKFRMNYAHASSEKYQDIGKDSVLVFQTVRAQIELRNSQSALIDTGKVQYYSGAWYDLGTTSGGVAAMDLLPYNYKFRMTYTKGSNEKYQDIGVNPTVVFQTANARLK